MKTTTKQLEAVAVTLAAEWGCTVEVARFIMRDVATKYLAGKAVSK